jgi:hypothetical protein
MDLNEVRAQVLHVVQEVRTLGVAGELDLLIGRKLLHDAVHAKGQRGPEILA